MGLFLKGALAIVVIAVGFRIYNQPQNPLFPNPLATPLPEHFGGKTNAKFKRVQDEFKQMFHDGWEAQGAAVAVYYNNELVVDLWGGYADEHAMRKWQQNTLTTVFSATKAVTALALAKLVDNGHMSYDDLVAKHWPEFAQNGKDNITVKIMASHQAGLSCTEPQVTLEDIRDWRKMGAILEKERPRWPAGTRFGYHALTHGWLADQLIRRVDPKKRSIGKYIQEELMKPTGSEELFVGLPTTLDHRVTRLHEAGAWDAFMHLISDWNFFKMLWPYFTNQLTPLAKKTFFEPEWLLGPIHSGGNPFNNPDIRRVEIAAANGIATARGLAQPFNALVNGKLLSKKTMDVIQRPLWVKQQDFVMGARVSGGYGFAHTRSSKNDTWLIGHPGHGGQNVKVDFKHKLAFAYVTNSLKLGMGDVTRTFKRMQNAIYDCL